MWRHVAAALLGALVLGAALPATAGAGGDTVRTTFRVDGMHCDGCSATIVGTLERIDGVLSASADHEKGVAEVTYRPDDVSPDELEAAIEKLGYKATVLETVAVEQRDA